MPNMSSALQHLTVIIPTYNRPIYARRAMRYWAKLGVKTLILDGGDAPMRLPLAATLSRKIRYLHRPESLAKRLLHAADLVSTKYCVLVGDDEFHLRSGLVRCIQELEANPDLVSCMGTAVGFSLNKSEQLRLRERYLGFVGHNLSSPSPAARMLTHMEDYSPTTVYSVLRKEVWRTCVQHTAQTETPFFASGELAFELTCAYLGQCKVIPQLLWMRSYENASVRTSKDVSLDTPNRLHDLWDQPDFQITRQAYIHSISKVISAQTGDDSGAVSAQTDTALAAYVRCVRDRRDKAAQPREAGAPAVRPAHLTLDEFCQLLSAKGIDYAKPELSHVARLVTPFTLPKRVKNRLRKMIGRK
jgi:glycosyltransferase domain-containing protein